jgi:hypothetical protein
MAERLLADCDLIADFSLLRGTASEIRTMMHKMIENVSKYAPLGARFVYISTVMAFGMGQTDRSFRQYPLARTIYGATKRYAEHLASRKGRQIGREVFVLRLGQVHGELQSVSRDLLRNLKDETAYVPSGPSWTVFAFTVAEALCNIANGKEKPGLYTLVSVPEWSWKELHQYYCQRAGIQPRIVEFGMGGTTPSWVQQATFRIARLIMDPLLAVTVRNRELLGGNFLFVFPSLERMAMALYAQRGAANQIAEHQRRTQYRPYDHLFMGTAPGRRLSSLSGSRTSMYELTSRIRAIIRLASEDE